MKFRELAPAVAIALTVATGCTTHSGEALVGETPTVPTTTTRPTSPVETGQLAGSRTCEALRVLGTQIELMPVGGETNTYSSPVEDTATALMLIFVDEFPDEVRNYPDSVEESQVASDIFGSIRIARLVGTSPTMTLAEQKKLALDEISGTTERYCKA